MEVGDGTGMGCGSVVEHLPNVLEELGLNVLERYERPVGNLNRCERVAGWSLGHRREGHSRDSYLGQ